MDQQIVTSQNFRFDFIASTGRTATTFIAAMLDRVEGVAACHEGYRASDKDSAPLLPLINLENGHIYRTPDAGAGIIEAKRGSDVLAQAAQDAMAAHVIDVAYYNAMLAAPMLAAHPECRMIGIIRNCADFVRSASTVEGEDPLPVGWPDPAKPLSQVEKFIAMGRISPRKGSDAASQWKSWDSIRRNIWLWGETNAMLLAAKDAFPTRVQLMQFETLQSDPAAFWASLLNFLDLDDAGDMTTQSRTDKINRKPAGYQVGPPATWSQTSQDALAESQKTINERAVYAC